MGIETALAVGALGLAAAGTGATISSARQQRDAQKRAEQASYIAKVRADQESARLAAEAEAEAQRLANIEAEVKKKAAAAANRIPSTIATSFSGLKTKAITAKKKLLGE